MALVVGNGVVRWSSDPLTTTSKVDAYALARGWSDWTVLPDEAAAAAILDASTYIRATFVPPPAIAPSVETEIENAVAEAARLTLSGPLIGGAGAAAPQVVREKVGPIETEYAETAPAQARESRLALVHAMMFAAGSRRVGGVNAPLTRA
jgi:hypothetical protein